MKKLLFVALLTTSVLLNAQVMPGINSKGGAMIIPKGKLKVGIKNITFKRDSMFNGTSEVNNQQKLNATVNVTLLGLRYGVSDNFEMRVMLPYKNIKSSAKPASNSVNIANSGLGDVIVMGKYMLLSAKKYGFALSVGAGLKLPTGSTDSTFKKAPAFATGMNTPLVTQMGTGEYEYKVEVGLSKVFDNEFRIDMHTMYTYRPKAKNNYDFGNELSYDVSLTKALTKQINIGLEYNGKYNTKTDMGDDANAKLRQILPFKAFSGTVGYITPEIEFLPFDKPKFHVGLGVSFLAHYNLKEYQPLEKQRFIFRIGYLF